MSESAPDRLEIHSVPTMTHGRVLVRPARAAAARGVLVGFHGYGETAAIQMQRLQAIPGASAWTLVSVQALHRFYDRRTGQVIACWMTHDDRDDAIADNLAYVATALEAVPHDDARPMVFAGFSQGVAMAYRAGCRGPRRAAGIISVGGDVPPELVQDRAVVFPPVLVVRGSSDELYPAAKFAADVAALTGRATGLTSASVAAGHEWTPEVADLAGGFLGRAGARSG